MRFALVALLLAGCGPKDPLKLENQLEREVQALHAVVRDLRYQAETCQESGSPGSVYTELHQVYAGTEISVEREGAVTVVTIPVAVLFTRADGKVFRDEAAMSLDMLATALELHTDSRIEVQGHTDDGLRTSGTQLELAFRYAEAVTKKLILDFGLGKERFIVSARGSWAPVASNDLEDGQARNRRVEIRIHPGNTEAVRP